MLLCLKSLFYVKYQHLNSIPHYNYYNAPSILQIHVVFDK